MGASTTYYTFYYNVNSCDNPSKWGLQQLMKDIKQIIEVVITPQNGVFNNPFGIKEE